MLGGRAGGGRALRFAKIFGENAKKFFNPAIAGGATNNVKTPPPDPPLQGLSGASGVIG